MATDGIEVDREGTKGTLKTAPEVEVGEVGFFEVSSDEEEDLRVTVGRPMVDERETEGIKDEVTDAFAGVYSPPLSLMLKEEGKSSSKSRWQIEKCVVVVEVTTSFGLIRIGS